MRFLHRHCASKQALRDALDEVEHRKDQYKVALADAAATASRHWRAGEKLTRERDAARASVREAAETIDRIGGEVVRLAEELTQAKKGRDEARAELATCQSDLRTARPLTRDEVERVVRENPTDDGELVEAILDAQRKATGDPVEAAHTAIEAAADATTREAT